MSAGVRSIGGESVWVEEADGGEPALLFLHGNSQAEVWRYQLEAEELARWRRVAFDFPGQGRSGFSDDPAHRYGLLGLAEMTAAMVEALGVERVVLVGYSLGGHVALEGAPDIPGLAGLFVFGMGPVTDAGDLPRLFKPNPAIDFISRAELTEGEALAFAEAIFGAPERIPEFFVEALRAVDPKERPALMASVAEGRHRDEVAVARALPCPLAIVYGEDDALIERSYLDTLDLPLWRGGVQGIPDSGHTPRWEQPARFNQLLRDFAESLV